MNSPVYVGITLCVRKKLSLLERKCLLLLTSMDVAVVGATASAINVGMVVAKTNTDVPPVK